MHHQMHCRFVQPDDKGCSFCGFKCENRTSAVLVCEECFDSLNGTAKGHLLNCMATKCLPPVIAAVLNDRFRKKKLLPPCYKLVQHRFYAGCMQNKELLVFESMCGL